MPYFLRTCEQQQPFQSAADMKHLVQPPEPTREGASYLAQKERRRLGHTEVPRLRGNILACFVVTDCLLAIRRRCTFCVARLLGFLLRMKHTLVRVLVVWSGTTALEARAVRSRLIEPTHLTERWSSHVPPTWIPHHTGTTTTSGT